MRIILVGGNKGLGKSLVDMLEWDYETYQVKLVNRKEYKTFDLRDPEEAIKSVIQEAIAELGGCDALVVSSGAGAYAPVTVKQDKVEEYMKVNFIGPTTCFRAAQRALLRSRGKAIFISSTVARRPGSAGLSYYAATKGAMNSWIQSEARRQAKHGVALCAVSPGFFDSPMTDDIAPKLKEASTKAIPFGRFGTCREVADFTLSLLHQSNWCLAGSIFEVSGGA